MPAAADDKRLSLSSIRAKYNDPTAFGPVDEWHQYTANEISRLISECWKKLDIRGKVLNAGSGSRDLGIGTERVINLDLAEWRVAHLREPVVANVEALPLASETLSAVICVGSVINYCDAASAIAEFGRVWRAGGYLLSEFESSYSGEYRRNKHFGMPVGVFETFYCGRNEVVWGYRVEYIQNLLKEANVIPIDILPIHILSPWILLWTSNLRISTVFGHGDPAARRIPGLARWASNFLMICRKHTHPPLRQS